MKAYPKSLTVIVLMLSSLLCHEPQPSAANTDRTDPIVQELLTGEKHIENNVLENFTEAEISYLINVVYAKHGYIFSKREYAEKFASRPWYKPRYKSVEGRLQAVDRSNIEVLVWKRNSIHFEKYTSETLPTLPSKLNDTEKALIGIWQPSPAMASGWSDTYTFFPNRTIAYRPNSMDCEDRLIFKVGHWFVSNKKIEISWFAEAKRIGGHFEEAAGSCASEKELIDDIPSSYRLKRPKPQAITISSIKYDTEFKQNLVEIDGSRFWQSRKNPNDY